MRIILRICRSFAVDIAKQSGLWYNNIRRIVVSDILSHIQNLLKKETRKMNKATRLLIGSLLAASLAVTACAFEKTNT